MVSKLYIRFKSFRIMKTLKKRKKKFNNCQGKNNSSSWLDQFSNLGNTDKSQICILIDAFLLQNKYTKIYDLYWQCFLAYKFQNKTNTQCSLLTIFLIFFIICCKIKSKLTTGFFQYTHTVCLKICFFTEACNAKLKNLYLMPCDKQSTLLQVFYWLIQLIKYEK